MGGGWHWEKSYTKNGQLIEAKEPLYYPDVCMEFTLDFFRRHREQPFYFYYPTHLIHGPILRTPDSKPGAKEFYEDDAAYLDKQVGQIVAELEKLGLREKTLIVFTGDNGTARFGADRSTLNGRKINGMKGSLLEGGSRVPLLASWKGVVPAGQVLGDLVDFSDFFATFAEVAGAKLPEGVALDSRSFAPQLRGEKGSPREWVFVQLGARWYVCDRCFKLNESGELFDLSDAPFAEKPVAKDTQDPAAVAARTCLQQALDTLSPAAGKVAAPDAKKGKGGKRKAKKARL
jgi:arylsulfatase A-like enzyme